MLNGGPMAANELPTIAKETQHSWIGSLYVRGPDRLGCHGAGTALLTTKTNAFTSVFTSANFK